MLEELYCRGFCRFYSGGARGFDLLAAERISAMQARHADIRLLLALPHPGQSSRWTDKDITRYEYTIYRADETHVLSQHYYHGCMMVRNRYMVDRSSLCLCYLNKASGGTKSTVEYAAKKGLQVVNLAKPKTCSSYVMDLMGVT